MSLFPRAFADELSPLFRMMDDYASLTRGLEARAGAGGAGGALRSFQPRFDVSETAQAYTLHGELPGIARKDVAIEWTDGNTLTVSGRTEHRAERTSAPDEQHAAAGAIEAANGAHYEKPHVEDEAGEAAQTTSTEVAKTKDGSTEVARPAAPQPKYWVSERSVGQFSRSFNFPARVDQDNVKASLKDGILEVVVPKASKPQSRKIEVQ